MVWAFHGDIPSERIKVPREPGLNVLPLLLQVQHSIQLQRKKKETTETKDKKGQTVKVSFV